jgi:large subunit ribosomal protein L21
VDFKIRFLVVVMFAVFQTGGKQYKVNKNRVLKIEKIDGTTGSKVVFDQVLMLGEASRALFIGTPIVKGAMVTAEITNQLKDNKVIIFKKKRRQNYRRKSGHRQEVTEIKILEITKA